MSFDPASGALVAQAGCVLGEIDEHVRQQVCGATVVARGEQSYSQLMLVILFHIQPPIQPPTHLPTLGSASKVSCNRPAL